MMETKMEAAEREDKLLTDMLDVIRFTEAVSAKLHRVTDEAKIYQVVAEEFAKSGRYTAGILLLADDGESLRVEAVSMPPSRLEVLEKASGLQAKEYRIALSKSGIFSQVVKEGKTVHTNISDTISEFLPRSLAYMISKTMGYENKSCIMTPLHKQGRVIGVLVMSCTELCQYFVHSVENLALHISTALEFAHKSAQRNRAVQALKKYHDHLGELVEERTAELKKVNEKLLEEITERKKAEEALQTEKNKLESLIGAMEDGLTIINTDYNIIYQNEPAKAASGGDHAGEKCYRALEGRERVDEGCPVEMAFKDGKSHTAERKTILPSGEVAFWENTANPIRDAAGRIVACLEVGRNITERKRAEEALRKIEQEKSAILNSMSELMVYQDAERRILWTNKAAADSVALSIEQLVGRRCYEVWHGSDKPCAGCPVAKAREIGKPQGAEMTTPDGRVWFVRGYPVRDANGNVAGMVEVARDITERKRSEEALRESEERYRWLADNVKDAIWLMDLELNFLWFSPSCERLRGYTMEEMKAMPLDKHVTPESFQRAWDMYVKCMDDEKQGNLDPNRFYGGEFEFFRKDGSTFWADCKMSFMRDENGKATAMLFEGIDITERKRAEEALADEVTRRRILVDQSLDGIVVLDVEARVVEANQRFAEMLGYSPEEVRKLHTWDWDKNFPPEKLLEMGRAVDEQGLHLETQHHRKDGSVIDVDISINGTVIAGQKLIFCVCRDITERNRAEEALRESQEFSSSLLESSPNPISVVNPDLSIKYVNPAFEKLTGFTLAEIIGMKAPFPWWPEGKGEQIVAALKDSMGHGGRKSGTEWDFQKKNGERFWATARSAPVIQEGKPVYLIINWLDTTERKQAEERLRLLGSVTQQVRDATLVTDLKFNITYVNKAAQDLFGYSAEEMRGKHMDFFNVEIPSKSFKQEIERCATSAGLWVGTMEKRRKDGSTFLSECHISPLYDNEGKISSYIDVLRDVTELRQAEEALRESQKFSSSLLESSPSPVTVVELDTSVRYVNPAFEKLTGFTLAEIAGRKAPYPWWPEGERERTLAAFKRTIKLGGIKISSEHNYQKKDGEHFWVVLNSAPVMQDGKPVYLIISWLDITERKQAEEALRESQKFSSSLLESSPIPINVVNLDTSVRYVNPAFEKLTGFTLAEIAGRKAPQPWWPEGTKKEVVAALKDSVEHGGRRSGHEHNFRKKNGERFWVTIESAPVIQEGKPVYLIISLLDITERKQAEEKEKQLQRELYLAQRLASVGELAAGVAHEINNPLTGVLGFSQRLIRKSKDEGFKRDLEIINSEARRAADVVQNLLTFARRRQPRKEKANINDILQRTLELRAYALQTSNIEVTTALAHSLPAIMVDFPQIQEVFLNILLNAEQAMSEANGRGKLVIKTRRLKDYVRVSFADDGPGISPRNLDKVFDPFFTTRADRGGTGLGLSACHGIVTEHGGRIYARSEPGEGATFIVELPLSPSETMLKRKA
jgi:PAS domain S-box-containing protein